MAQTPLGEFDLIQRFFKDRFAEHSRLFEGVALGIGDDCAILSLPPGQELVVSVDTLNQGVHFPENSPAEKLARRALACAVSDLAAMGAKPLGFTLCLSAPQLSASWLEAFSSGLYAAAQDFSIALVGGDTTRSEQLSLSVQVMGSVAQGRALRRSGANPGDQIFVSGKVGDARAALDFLDRPTGENAEYFLNAYWSPVPRLLLGQSLVGLASAAIDISDGLLADLNHILQASGLGAKIDLDKIPRSSPLAAAYGDAVAQDYALSGGDDYELCFTVPVDRVQQLARLTERSGLQLTHIGEIEAAPGLRAANAAQQALLNIRGYTHF